MQVSSSKPMIRLTRLNHGSVVVNADLIEHIEITPDTVISMTTGQRFTVLESADEVIERVIRYRRSVFPGVALPDVRNDSRE